MFGLLCISYGAGERFIDMLKNAVENGNLSMVKTLVYAGVNINAKERRGATALAIAVLKFARELCYI